MFRSAIAPRRAAHARTKWLDPTRVLPSCFLTLPKTRPPGYRLCKGYAAHHFDSVANSLHAGGMTAGLVSAGALAVNAGDLRSASLGFAAPHIWYLHVPKTATAFMLEVVYSTCPDMPRADLTSPQCMYGPEACVLGSPAFPACAPKFAHMAMGHDSPKDEAFNDQTPFVGMFREPFNRVASGFVHAFHDCPEMTQRYGCDEHALDLCPGVAHVTDEKVAEYFHCVQGCQGRMLTGRPCGDDGRGPVDVNEAVGRIESNFMYAGITDRFEESVKDFHRLIGAPGEVAEAAFRTSNPQRGGEQGQSIEKRVVEILQRLQLVDEVDDAVYAAALKKNDEVHAQLEAEGEAR